MRWQGTQPPSDKLLQRKPYSSTTSLIQLRMWRHISVQVGRRGGLEVNGFSPRSSTSALAAFVRPLRRRSLAQAAFQFIVLMAFLIRGDSWLGVSQDFLDTTGEGCDGQVQLLSDR